MEIVIDHVSKRFNKKEVLHDISLKADAGILLCLLGPSGAGKTTLIRLITGSISPEEGEIRADGKKIPDLAILKRMGYMPQNDAVYNDISGYDNLLFYAKMFGLRGGELKTHVDEALELVGLTEDKDKLVGNYSGGMKKRLSLAIALVHNPDALLLDEPTVGIDPVLRKTIWDKFDALSRSGKTVIITTHVMDEAVRCQRAALIYRGQLIEDDTVDALIAKTESGSLEELFFSAEKAGEK